MRLMLAMRATISAGLRPKCNGRDGRSAWHMDRLLCQVWWCNVMQGSYTSIGLRASAPRRNLGSRGSNISLPHFASPWETIGGPWECSAFTSCSVEDQFDVYSRFSRLFLQFHWKGYGWLVLREILCWNQEVHQSSWWNPLQKLANSGPLIPLSLEFGWPCVVLNQQSWCITAIWRARICLTILILAPLPCSPACVTARSSETGCSPRLQTVTCDTLVHFVPPEISRNCRRWPRA